MRVWIEFAQDKAGYFVRLKTVEHKRDFFFFITAGLSTTEDCRTSVIVSHYAATGSSDLRRTVPL